jgi:histidyl-tRNA synthetase
MVDHLCDPCRQHFERVQAGLGALEVPFAIETRLVRGLDYYVRTTFEVQSSALESAQNALGGGGRYDGLSELLGGPPTPGIGFGSGIERILLACDAEGVLPAVPPRPDVWIVDICGGEHARDLTAELRRAGLAADRSFDARSMRAQMKAADRSGAAFSVILGQRELERGEVVVKDLSSGDQVDVPRDQVSAWLRARREFDR